MRRPWLSAAGAAGVLMLAVACSRGDERGDHLTSVSAGDPEVNAAIAQAQATLPVFWAKYDAHDLAASEFRIKARLPTAHGSIEHIWVDVTGHDAGGAKGTLANDPEDLGALKFGSPVTVEAGKITDWMYLKGGKIYGGYTIRALVDRAAPDERRKVEAMLPPTPLEPKSN